MERNLLTVSKTKKGINHFPLLQEAIDYSKTLEGAIIIEVEPGLYYEKLVIDRPNLTFKGLGQEASDVIISYDDYAFSLMVDGSRRGTFRSYSVFVDADNVSFYNLTIENSSGDSKTHGQAIALYAEGDGLYLENCRLLGHQDTLFTGPLPPKELQPNGFIGPKQFAPRINGRQLYKSCYICGDVDFIFGSCTAYFEDCTIESLKRTDQDEIQGYVTAASTMEGIEFGYVFNHCRLIAKDLPQGSVYLGRPWRNFAKTAFLNCEFGPHINAEGFHDWNKTDAHETITYQEYNNSCNEVPFSSKALFVKRLSDEEANRYTIEKVLSHK